MGHALARDTVTIGHDNVRALAVEEVQTCTARGVRADEIVRRSLIQQRYELMCANLDAQLHGVRCADSCDSGQRDQRSVRIKRRLISTKRRCLVVVGVVWLLDDVVVDLEVEQPGTLVPPYIWLIAVVAEPLFATVRHLLG